MSEVQEMKERFESVGKHAAAIASAFDGIDVSDARSMVDAIERARRHQNWIDQDIGQVLEIAPYLHTEADR